LSYICLLLFLGTPANQQGLEYKGKPLSNEKTVGEYKIEKGAIIDLVMPPQEVEVFVKTPAGKRISLSVNNADTIQRVKEKIGGEEGVYILSIDLIFE
jgi:hypothetical protein